MLITTSDLCKVKMLLISRFNSAFLEVHVILTLLAAYEISLKIRNFMLYTVRHITLLT